MRGPSHHTILNIIRRIIRNNVPGKLNFLYIIFSSVNASTRSCGCCIYQELMAFIPINQVIKLQSISNARKADGLLDGAHIRNLVLKRNFSFQRSIRDNVHLLLALQFDIFLEMVYFNYNILIRLYFSLLQ